VFQQRSTCLAVVIALATFMGACDEAPTSTQESQQTITGYVASVSIDGTQGEMRALAVPWPTGGGPTVTVDGHVTIVNGGTTTVDLTSSTPIQTVYVAGSPPTSPLFVPVSGYFEIPLAAPATSAELIITFPQALASNEFDLHFSAADPEGRVGMVTAKSYDAIVVGTGDIQVTLAWDSDADVDLHVVDPGGSEIYWGEPQSPSGGRLDLDSNAACMLDDVRNENITWPVGSAPQGSYTVRVDYWSSCDASETNYTVLIHNEGQSDLHHGTFRGEGDGGGRGSGVEIATFTRSTGAPAPVPGRSSLSLQSRPITK
jgi:hypothetical protein